MAIIILNHKVKDFSAWKPFFDADNERRRSSGLRIWKVCTKHGDPNDVYMIFEADDPDSFQTMANDPGLREIMEKAGVISEPKIELILDVK